MTLSAADDHRLDLGVVDVVRDDGPAAGDLLTHELGRDEVGDRGAEVLAVADAGGVLLAPQVLADGDIFHLGRDDAGLGVFVLGDRTALDALEHLVVGDVEARGEVAAGGVAVVLGLHFAGLEDGCDVAAVQLPAGLDQGQAALDVDRDGRVGVGAGGVIDGHRRLVGRRVDGDLAEGDADVGVEFARDIDLARPGALAGRDGPGFLHHRLAGVFQSQFDIGLFREGRRGDGDVHGGLRC
jgi:hypothetical protein